MPQIKSAQKALRQNARHRARNLKRQKQLKTTVKKFEKLLADGKQEEAQQFLAQTYKTADKLAKVGFLKKNKARRVKSRLAKKLGAKK